MCLEKCETHETTVWCVSLQEMRLIPPETVCERHETADLCLSRNLNIRGIFYEGTFGYSSSDMGHYWTSTPNTNGNTKAYYVGFYHNVCEVRSGDTNSGDSGVYRSSRLSVRLVRTAN